MMDSNTTAAATRDVQLSADGKLLAVHVPMQFRKRGGRKVVVAPSEALATPQPLSRQDGSNRAPTVRPSGLDVGLIKALAQAHRWQSLLDEGKYATLGDLAKAEKMDKSFVARTLRLTLLAPIIIEAILDGRQMETAQRQTLLRQMPLVWEEQERTLAAA